MKNYIRKHLFNQLWENLHGSPNLIQVITGPRQVGKTTLALQVLDKWPGGKIYESADNPNIPSLEWIASQWQKARDVFSANGREVLLVLDEIQKIPRWSGMVKNLVDEDKRLKYKIRVVLLGSSALLMQRGLTESLAGRFEIHRHFHWSFEECRQYFSLSLEQYLYFGGYPGALSLRKNWERWSRYIRDSLIETVLSKDILLMTPVTKPALLRQIFGLATAYPAEIVSYQKMLGQLQDAGNTTTLASYIKLLSNAFLAVALERFSGSRIKQRGSIPKLIVLDNALVTALSGRDYKRLKQDKTFWGRITENAVGAKLYAMLQDKGISLFYWRERQMEVDFVFKIGDKLVAIEVKSSGKKPELMSLLAFARRYKNVQPIIISPKNELAGKSIKSISLEQFFKNPESVFAV